MTGKSLIVTPKRPRDSFIDRVFRRADGRRAPAGPRRNRVVLPGSHFNIYAIGDVHGCLDLLLALEQRIVSDSQRFPDRQNIIIMLGDLIDRGPQSAQMLAHLLEPPPVGFERLALAGNHEEAMLEFLADPASATLWLDVGGRETLASYGAAPIPRAPGRRDLRRIAMEAVALIPKEHLRFLRELPVAAIAGKSLFVHAGIRSNVPLEEQSDRDLQEVRYGPTDATDPGVIIVHGHTPSLRPAILGNRVALDTASYSTGVLAAARIRDEDVEFIIAGRHEGYPSAAIAKDKGAPYV